MPRGKPKGPPKICEQCGAEHYPRTGHTVCYKCRARAAAAIQNEKRRLQNIKTIECKVCFTKFRTSDGRRQICDDAASATLRTRGERRRLTMTNSARHPRPKSGSRW